MKKSKPREAVLRHEILSFIRPWTPRTRGELSRRTGFSTATVSRIARRLISANLLTEEAPSAAPVGRPCRRLQINGAYGTVLGISLLPPALKALVLDLRGDVLKEQSRPIEWRSRRDALLDALRKLIETTLRNRPPGTPRLLGAGLAVPGVWDPKDGVCVQFPRIADFRSVPIRKLLEEWTQAPATLIGYGPSLALAEFARTPDAPPGNLLCVEVAENIAMGAIVNGGLLRGAAGNAGELGHLTLGNSGKVCYCGNAGCLETVATCSAVEEAFRQSDAASDLFADPAKATYEDVVRLAREKDSFSSRLLARSARTLGEGLAAAVNLFNPERLVLNGRYFDAGDLVLDPLKAAFHDRALPNMSGRMAIDRSPIGGAAAALGAGVAALEAALERL
jgi:predicted NBD/HSP70 family sugar kinase